MNVSIILLIMRQYIITCPYHSRVKRYLQSPALLLKTLARRLHSVFAFDAGNVTLRLANFIVHKTSKRKEREDYLLHSIVTVAFCVCINYFFFC